MTLFDRFYNFSSIPLTPEEKVPNFIENIIQIGTQLLTPLIRTIYSIGSKNTAFITSLSK